MNPTLLVLAAGMGSRYGGLKQVDPVGPFGESVLDYAVYDAIRAGYGRVVFVIRRDFEDLFRNQIGSKYSGHIAVDYVFQSIEELPEVFTTPDSREKPWGTGHAVLCARHTVKGPFAVINADDFYGADSFEQLGQFLRKPKTGSVADFGMVGYRLANTLSENGSVSRGVCSADQTGLLQEVVEHTAIQAKDVGVGQKYTGTEIVSLNCWGFTPALFAALDQQFQEFLNRHQEEPKSEFYLPAAVSTMITRSEAHVTLLNTESTWFGVTYREDKPHVVAAIADLVKRGDYPEKLF